MITKHPKSLLGMAQSDVIDALEAVPAPCWTRPKACATGYGGTAPTSWPAQSATGSCTGMAAGGGPSRPTPRRSSRPSGARELRDAVEPPRPWLSLSESERAEYRQKAEVTLAAWTAEDSVAGG